jgi:membrane protease subunit HflC
MRTFLTILVVLLLIVVARLCVYTVDAAEYAYVTVLGRHVASFDGSQAEEAGLHVGWPWPIQVVQRIDRRTQLFDLPTTELLTHDPEGKTIDKTLSVDGYVLWQIADRDSVDLFLRRLGSPERARAVLVPRVNSQLGAAIAQTHMDEFISTAPGKEPGHTRVDDTVARLHSSLISSLKQQVREEFGVDLIDIRLRRFSHPAEVRSSIFARIKSERAKKVTEYQAEGERLASNLKSKADEEVSGILSKARFEESEIKSKADTEALGIRNQAQRQDPEFYGFLKQMEKLQSILGESKSVLLLSTHRSIFDMLFQPPRADAVGEKSSKEKKQ